MATSIKAYLLIETRAGTGNAVLDGLKSLEQTVQVDRVTGPYDIICVIETGSLDDLGEIVRERVHSMDGVTRTMSCIRLGE
ncbi:MAG: Lrp/AsnC ligand binding domain-containing protein [Chloroflexi bacterium]|nr:Lrp/AsnC ligand binding domain-containing protein [Chloroflexota bacterium]MCH8116042.1 Lrp/AsnC ligand binding domain-containing protein [Chloroflexota bacterium]MCI0774572.1 Lrp/AsnC ligand binding domain-containing protein [Chloroflexota bacterium]MCI0804331.1 Lrp/AsnC ligand binding domain-containing protein [Chloroflexota bacterium]MCI0809436.1 Lrp/AsnC ligand binding domain-containing protein [Chloroflexota bacterium]